MSSNKRALSAAATVAAGLAIVGGAAVANAATGTPSPSPSGTSGYSAPGYGAGEAAPAQNGQNGQDQQRQAPQHTTVTGDEATKVGAAVTAKDSAVTVTKVEKDGDGSYDVSGTKNGAQVRYEVSADLATVTLDQGRGGRGGHGGGQDTPVTGDEATKVGAAVTAKDSAVTVTSVQKDPDGSYDVLGTKNGQQVMFDVSKDLATVTQAQQGPGGQGGRGGHQRGQQGQTQQGQTQQGQTQQGQTQTQQG